MGLKKINNFLKDRCLLTLFLFLIITSHQQLKNMINQSLKIYPSLGSGHYFLNYFNLFFSSSKTFARRILSKNLKAFPLAKNDKEKERIASLCNLSIKKLGGLNLPKLKVDPRKLNKKGEWVYSFDNKEAIESVDAYDFLIKNPAINRKDKGILDSILIQSMMADLILASYYSNKKQTSYSSGYLNQKFQKSIKEGWSYSPLEELENILHRGHVFNSQLSRFLTLSSIFGYRELFENLGMKFKVICFQEFAKLNIIAKKALTAILLNAKNEEAIFNLLGYGLKLDWEIQTKDGVKNIVIFEMLHSLQWVKLFLENRNLDIRLTNCRGENILHLIGANALSQPSIEEALRRRLSELDSQEKENFFFQLNEENLTPLMKALIYQDDTMINFMKGYNIKPWDKLEGDLKYKSAMDFLNDYILKRNNDHSWGSLIDYFRDSFWMGLAKQWNSEFYYQQLQTELTVSSGIINKKVIKI